MNNQKNEKKFVTTEGTTYQLLPYEKNFGEIELSLEIQEQLRNLTLEEQMKKFRITRKIYYVKTYYGEEEIDNIRKNSYALEKYSDVLGLILFEGVIVGILINSYYGICPLMLNKGVTTYYACDNNGSGYKEYEEYAFLIYLG